MISQNPLFYEDKSSFAGGGEEGKRRREAFA